MALNNAGMELHCCNQATSGTCGQPPPISHPFTCLTHGESHRTCSHPMARLVPCMQLPAFPALQSQRTLRESSRIYPGKSLDLFLKWIAAGSWKFNASVCLKLALGVCNLRKFDVGWMWYTKRKQLIRKKYSNQNLQQDPKATISPQLLLHPSSCCSNLLSILPPQQRNGKRPILLEGIWVQRKQRGFPSATHQRNYK